METVWNTRHIYLAALSAGLFAAGVVLSRPVIRNDVRWLKALPIWVFRNVLKLLGSQPSLLRMTIVIFLFNGTAMFAYMSSGFCPLAPEIIAVLTGLNVAVIFGSAHELSELNESGRPSSSQWIPGTPITIACSIMVPVLELPCFWYSIAMGISMGQDVMSGAASYFEAFEVRGRAYGGVIIPVLFLSAVCESIAVRGSGGFAARTESDSAE